MGIDFLGQVGDYAIYGDLPDSNSICQVVWGKSSTSAGNDGYCGHWTGGQESYIVYQINSTTQAGLVRQSNINKTASSTTDYTDGAWHCLAGGGDEVNARLYVDSGDNDITGTAYTTIDVHSGDFVTGSYAAAAGVQMVGEQQAVCVYNEWLSDAHLDALHRGVCGFVMRHDALVHYSPQYDNDIPGPQWVLGGTKGSVVGDQGRSSTNPPVEMVENYL